MEARAWFIGEPVAREVVGREFDGPFEVASPRVERLTGDGEDQIEVGVGDAGGAAVLKGFGYLVWLVGPFEHAEFGRLEGLGAERDAIDAEVVHEAGELGRNGGWVGFECTFDGTVGGAVLIDGVEQVAQDIGGQGGGGSAADEDGVEVQLVMSRVVVEFGFESGDERVGGARIEDFGVEVAIAAASAAEGDVDVKGVYGRHCQ